MTEEDRIAHDAFAEALIKAMAPEGALELQLAQRIATDSWRLNRSSAIEDNIFALGFTDHASDIDADHPELHAALTAARTFTREAKSIELLTLYEQRINRSLQKNLGLLQQLQATRKAERKAEMEQRPNSSTPMKSKIYQAIRPRDTTKMGLFFRTAPTPPRRPRTTDFPIRPPTNPSPRPPELPTPEIPQH